MTETRIKICGITNLADAVASAKAGVDLLGYILYPPSKRYVKAETIYEIVTEIKHNFPHVQHVAVTVNEPFHRLLQIRRTTSVDMLQLHGRESPSTVTALRQDGTPVIKAIPINGDEMTLDPSKYEADFLLFDTHSPATHGGTGKQFNLTALAGCVSLANVFIAGGFTPNNISAVLKVVSPYAVDVASGVEKSSGLKDHTLVTSFINEVRSHINPA